MKQAVEVLWWPKGWAPTTISVHPSIAAAERAARALCKRMTSPGTISIRVHYGPDAGERTLFDLVEGPIR